MQHSCREGTCIIAHDNGMLCIETADVCPAKSSYCEKENPTSNLIPVITTHRSIHSLLTTPEAKFWALAVV